MAIRTYKDLQVWQKAVSLAKAVYEITREYPKSELYGITSQMRRSSVSIASNIAEGYGRKSTGDYCRFLTIAMGSLFELETQLIISHEIEFISGVKFNDMSERIDEVERMLSSLSRKIISFSKK